MKKTLALVSALVVLSSPAFAGEKSRAALQTDLGNHKYSTFNPLSNYDDLINLTDSHFNKTTDTLDDITDGTTNSLIPAADATLLGALTGTAVEINRLTDDSARLVDVSGTTTLTCAANGEGIINYISAATDSTITLPAATGTGCGYKLTWMTLPAQSGQAGDVLQVTGDDEIRGVILSVPDDATALSGWKAAGGSDNDQMTFTSSTKFVSTKGAWVKVTDVATDVWHIEGVGSSTGTEATPFTTGQRP